MQAEDLEIRALADVKADSSSHFIEPRRRENWISVLYGRLRLSFDHFGGQLPRQELSRLNLLELFLVGLLVPVLGVRVVGWRNLQNGVNQQIEIRLLMAYSKVEVLVNFVERFGVDALGQMGVLFGPVFEDKFEVGADADCLLQKLLDMLI